VAVDELIYLASEFAGDGPIGANSGFDTYLGSLMKTWNALNGIDPLVVPGRAKIEYPTFPAPVKGNIVAAAAA
jgi:hypothetical protein